MIAGYILTDIAIFFLVYAVIGWVTEVIYQAVSKGIVVNRGFVKWTYLSDIWFWFTFCYPSGKGAWIRP